MVGSYYIHIPFCRQKCPYCKFALTPVFDELKKKRYIEYLKKEIRTYFLENPSDYIETIYFGGGTPSILSVDEISSILSLFPRDQDTEITIECNPEDITHEYIDGLISLGVNRFSIGVQTLNNLSLREIHRSSRDSILMALSAFQERDITGISLSVDFIIGLPHVDYGETLRDMEYLHGAYLMITHTSIYLLEDELYPAHWASISMDQSSRNQEYLDIQKYLGESGYHHYEFSNWARPGYECRHNQAYWNHVNYRGFGLSAASYVDGKRYTQSESFAGYYRGELAHDEVLTPSDIELEELMFRMRTFSLEAQRYENRPRCISLIEEGLIEIRDGYIVPTKTGIFLLDYIIGELV